MNSKLFLCVVLAGALSACVSTQSPDATNDARLDRMFAGESYLSGAELDEATQAASQNALGTPENPVRAEMPQGQRAYLNRLRCADGDRPEYYRIGSFGVGVYGNIIDKYAVTCGNRKRFDITMDMYHRGHIEQRAVPGFTIVKP